MFYYIFFVATAAIIYGLHRKFGRNFYLRLSHLSFFKRAIVKSRPPTPPLIETRDDSGLDMVILKNYD